MIQNDYIDRLKQLINSEPDIFFMGKIGSISYEQYIQIHLAIKENDLLALKKILDDNIKEEPFVGEFIYQLIDLKRVDILILFFDEFQILKEKAQKILPRLYDIRLEFENEGCNQLSQYFNSIEEEKTLNILLKNPNQKVQKIIL
jgi:hypothetical protein